MKKLLLLATLLIGFLAQAQFTPGQLKELTQEQAIDFANEIAVNAKMPLQLIQAEENTKGDYFVANYGIGENTLKVVFTVFYKGENKALEIAGVKTYRFYEASGSYLDLFPIWKKVFRPDVNLEKTVSDFNSQELINRAANINFKLKGEDDQWRITNWM
jgi:hypothetical protein